jgi:hypothetical protein
MTGLLRAWLAGFRKGFVVIMLGFFFMGGVGTSAYADQKKSEVLEGFIAHQAEEHSVKAVPDRRRHQILFVMGACLLIGILTTAGFGIAMALFGKEVFAAHMVSAGLTVFLAVAHAVTSIVWFFPF